jgi:hypothetical protein
MPTGTIKFKHNGKTFSMSVEMPHVPESRKQELREYEEKEDKKKARQLSINKAMRCGLPNNEDEWEEYYNKSILVCSPNIKKYLTDNDFYEYDYINQITPSLSIANKGDDYDLIIIDFLQEFDYEFLIKCLTKLIHGDRGDFPHILAFLPSWWDDDEEINKYIFNSYYDGCGVELEYLSSSFMISGEIIRQFDILNDDGSAEKYEWVEFWLSPKMR